MKLNQSLYAYVWKGSDNNCNSYLYANVLKGNKHIMIDPGHIITPYLHEDAYQRLVDQIEADGLKAADVGLVILTHAHPDHVEAAEKFQTLYGAPVALHKDEMNSYKDFGGTGKIDILLEEGPLDKFVPTLSPVEIIQVPGHSPGHIAVYWPSQKALAAGDVIFFRSMGRMDLPGGDEAAMKASVDRLSKLDLEFVFCGHAYMHSGVLQGKDTIKRNFDMVKQLF